MSVNIDWKCLDAAFGRRTKDLLNAHLSGVVDLPDFLQSLTILQFDLGSIAPDITIEEIGDPFAEFYEDDHEDELDEGEAGAAGEHSEDKHNVKAQSSHLEAPQHASSSSRRSSLAAGAAQHDPMTDHETASVISEPPPYAEHLAHQQLHHSGWEGVHVPYFHSAFATPNGGIVSASGLATPQPGLSSWNTPFQPLPAFHQDSNNHSDSRRRRSSGLNSLAGSSGHAREDQRAGAAAAAAAAPEDTQVQVRVAYQGNLMLALEARLALNYPSSAFVTLPIEMTVSGFEIEATAIIAYINKHKKVHVALLEGAESPIRAMKMTSVIGEQGKISLTDVDRLEKFMVKEIQDVVEREFVLPSYYTFIL